MTTEHTLRILPPSHVNCEPQSVWADWVGEQTPGEFLAVCVSRYVDEVGREPLGSDPPLTDAERANLEACLLEVVDSAATPPPTDTSPRAAVVAHAELNRQELREGQRRTQYAGPDLRSVDLSGADLSETNLRGADLRKTDLSDAYLRKTDLRGADLSETNLRSADLSNANLNCADLNCADLNCADLRNADLRNADLRSADLRGADLSGADLDGARRCREGGASDE